MKVVPNLVREFEEICEDHQKIPNGRDLIRLIMMFGNQNDDLDENTEKEVYLAAWREFIELHRHQMSVIMVGMLIYYLMTYWPQGQRLYDALPTLEQMLVRDTVQEIDEAIRVRSAENGRGSSA